MTDLTPHDRNLDHLRLYNLASWYLLPLIGLNPYSFGGLENFHNCYVSSDGGFLAVSIHSPEFAYLAMESPFYVGDKTLKGTSEYFLVYRLDDVWQNDFIAFMAGEYSKFTAEAKELIVKYSGMAYRRAKDEGEGTVTDLRILALSTDPVDRENLANAMGEMLNTDAPDPTQELLWRPSINEYLEDLP